MTQKHLRYIALALNVVIVFFLMFLSPYGDGLFSYKIYFTFVHEMFEHFFRNVFNLRYSEAELFFYMLWSLTLAAGIFASWKLRHKTAGLLSKIIKTVDDNI